MVINESKCKTKYPILLVHGIGFRECKSNRYWGRIPSTLKSYGATIYRSTQDGWGKIETNAIDLAHQVDNIIYETGAEKVNIIAHSKGGIDSRHLLSLPDTYYKISSITTISTPHKGSKSMDLIMNIPGFLVKFAGIFINIISKISGDKNPAFYEACLQMTTSRMSKFNNQYNYTHDALCQSYGAVMEKATSDIIMALQYKIVKAIEGENDGLVALDSASWENFKGAIVSNSKRGVSHTDIVDLRRRPFSKFNTTEFNKKYNSKINKHIYINDIIEIYIDIVNDLKKRGL